MVSDLSYETALAVIDSWEVLRRKRNYAETMGKGLFIKFLREVPEARSILGFDETKGSFDEEAMYSSGNFREVAKNFVQVIDQAVDMLGPDLDMLTDIFVELGDKHHKEYNLKPRYYPILGRVLLDQLEEMLGPSVFTDHTRTCWLQVYEALSLDMASTSIAGRNVKTTLSESQHRRNREYVLPPAKETDSDPEDSTSHNSDFGESHGDYEAVRSNGFTHRRKSIW